MSFRKKLSEWIYKSQSVGTPSIKIGSVKTRRSEKLKEQKGKVISGSQWVEFAPHPPHMGNYEVLNNDPEVNTAITVLTDMIATRFYTQMPEEIKEGDKHPNKAVVDDWAENTNLDELLSEIVSVEFEYGFSPVEKIDVKDGEYGTIQPDYFFVNWDKKGNIKGYSEREQITGPEIAKWNKDEIIYFVNKGRRWKPYGKALVEPIIRQLGSRNDINDALPDVIANIAYPFRIFVCATNEIRDVVYDQVTKRETYENAFIGSVNPQTDILIHEVATDPRFNPTQMLEHFDFQISEGLFAPLLMYLRNATEASATKMMEAIDRHVEGRQKYYKRRVERYMFKPLVNDPVPRLMWGSSEPTMEEVSLADLSQIIMSSVPRVISVPEMRNVLRGYIELEDGDLDKEQPLSDPNMQQPFQQLPFNQRKGLDMSLATLQQAFNTKKLSLTETFKQAHHVLDTFFAREKQDALKFMSSSMRKRLTKLSPETETYYGILRNEVFNDFREKVLPLNVKVNADTNRSFKVTIK